MDLYSRQVIGWSMGGRIDTDLVLARSDVFHYIEMFCNPRRRHGTAEGLSPVEVEQRQSQRLKGVWGSRGDSLPIN